ncbi:MAG: hypothetical protein V2I33_16235 [Kangiellaceae bacterium]|nr:hypothetical protein [Kangiellaceae bacterium]
MTEFTERGDSEPVQSDSESSDEEGVAPDNVQQPIEEPVSHQLLPQPIMASQEDLNRLMQALDQAKQQLNDLQNAQAAVNAQNDALRQRVADLGNRPVQQPREAQVTDGMIADMKASLARFDPEVNFDLFIRELDTICQSYLLSDNIKARVLPRVLPSPMIEEYFNLPGEDQREYDRAVAALRQVARDNGVKQTMRLHDIMNRKQGENERFAVYFAELRRKLRELHPRVAEERNAAGNVTNQNEIDKEEKRFEDSLFSIAMAGVKESLRREILRARPKTVKDLKEAAVYAEDMNRYTPTESTDLKEIAAQVKTIHSELRKQTAEVSQLSAKPKQQAQAGEGRRKGQNLKAEAAQFCLFCQAVGSHDANHCPRLQAMGGGRQKAPTPNFPQFQGFRGARPQQPRAMTPWQMGQMGGYPQRQPMFRQNAFPRQPWQTQRQPYACYQQRPNQQAIQYMQGPQRRGYTGRPRQGRVNQIEAESDMNQMGENVQLVESPQGAIVEYHPALVPQTNQTSCPNVNEVDAVPRSQPRPLISEQGHWQGTPKQLKQLLAASKAKVTAMYVSTICEARLLTGESSKPKPNGTQTKKFKPVATQTPQQRPEIQSQQKEAISRALHVISQTQKETVSQNQQTKIQQKSDSQPQQEQLVTAFQQNEQTAQLQTPQVKGKTVKAKAVANNLAVYWEQEKEQRTEVTEMGEQDRGKVKRRDTKEEQQRHNIERGLGKSQISRLATVLLLVLQLLSQTAGTSAWTSSEMRRQEVDHSQYARGLMFCPRSTKPLIMSLPSQLECKRFETAVPSPIPLKLKLFIPNKGQRSVRLHACSLDKIKVKHWKSVRKGTKRKRSHISMVVQPVKVTRDQCNNWQRNKRSRKGQLKPIHSVGHNYKIFRTMTFHSHVDSASRPDRGENTSYVATLIEDIPAQLSAEGKFTANALDLSTCDYKESWCVITFTPKGFQDLPIPLRAKQSPWRNTLRTADDKKVSGVRAMHLLWQAEKDYRCPMRELREVSGHLFNN